MKREHSDPFPLCIVLYIAILVVVICFCWKENKKILTKVKICQPVEVKVDRMTLAEKMKLSEKVRFDE